MASMTHTLTNDTQVSLYDNVIGPVRWSGRPLRFWYALFLDFGNSRPVSCVKAVRMRFGLGPVSVYPLDGIARG